MRPRTPGLGIVAAWVLAVLAQPGSAEAGRKLPNMPQGWTWPPSVQMRAAGTRCLADLDLAEVAWEPGPTTRRVTTPILVPSLELGAIRLQPIFRDPPFVMDCHLARALAAHADDVRAVGVAALRFSTIHDYRTIRRRGRRSKILSRHALGLAIDVYEVELVDGTVLEVQSQYAAGHPILHALEHVLAGAEELRTPLTPGNDPKSHGDHFHLEARMDIGQE